MQDYIPREIDINGRIENIVVKQYDNNSRYLHVTISDADLTDGTFELTGCSTALYIKPEGSEDDSGVSFVSGGIADADEGIVTFLPPPRYWMRMFVSETFLMGSPSIPVMMMPNC